MDEKKVVVLLPTFNGEKYLKEQLDSILNQSYKNIEIYIRDDGSTDSTCEILDAYSHFPNIKIFKGENIGVIKSFFKLLEMAPNDAYYYGFCDQDDVWHKEKIKRAVDALSTIDEPALYYCRLDIVDDKLKHLKYYFKPKMPLELKTAIAGNCVTGTATVINRKGRALIIEKIPEYTVMHDWWTYIVISAFGKVIYDEFPGLKYRQHSSNVVGLKVNFFSFVLLRIKKLRNGVYYKKISKQAQEFFDIYGNRLNGNDRILVEEFLKPRNSFAARFLYAIRCPMYRQSKIDTIIMKAMILFNHI